MARRRFRFIPQTTTIGAAVTDGQAMVEELQGEAQEWLDGLPENLQQGDTGSRLEQCVSLLEGIDLEIDVPEDAAGLTVEYQDTVPADKRRGPSRNTRAGNVAAMLEAAADALSAWADELEEGSEAVDEARTAVEQISAAHQELGETDFPGMYGN